MLDEDRLEQGLKQKWLALKSCLSELGSALIAVSGGVDSALLTFAAAAALPERVFAVTVNHELMKESEKEAAFAVVREMRVPWQSLGINALTVPEIAFNSVDRCYTCKKHIFEALLPVAKKRGVAAVCEGRTQSDKNRPGDRAAEELNIIQPLYQAGLNKREVRFLAREAGLSMWSRQVEPCMATRFAAGEALTEAALEQVEKGENILLRAGFTACRLHPRGDTCRIEIPRESLPALIAAADSVINPLKELGFSYICADLTGGRAAGDDETDQEAD